MQFIGRFNSWVQGLAAVKQRRLPPSYSDSSPSTHGVRGYYSILRVRSSYITASGWQIHSNAWSRVFKPRINYSARSAAMCIPI